MAGFRYDPKGCFSHVHGAYEQELNRRRSAAESIEWVDVDEQFMLKHQVRAAAASPPGRVNHQRANATACI